MEISARRGRFIKYDKQQVLQEIVDGRMSAAEIAEKHGITRDMVYSLKFAAKKKNIIRDPVQKLDDLDAIEPRCKKGGPYAHEIHLLAQDYSSGVIGGVSFRKKLCEILGERFNG